MNADLAGVKRAMAEREALLRAELGDNILQIGQWSNGIGQMGLYANADGLRSLKRSGKAVSFRRDMAWFDRSPLDNLDGSLTAISTALNTQVTVDIVITVDSNELEYSSSRNGISSFLVPSGQEIEATSKVSEFIATLRGQVGAQAGSG